MASASEVAKHLIISLPMDNLKLQKLLYYCQAIHLVLYNKTRFFPELIEAWTYGPVVPNVYKEYESYGLETIYLSKEGTNSLTLTSIEQKSANIAMELYGNMSGTDLIEQTQYESPWKNAYRPVKPGNIIPVDSMYEYFKETLILPETESSTNIPSRETIKTMFFENLKDSVDTLIPQNNDISYSKNPFVDIETIAKNVGITNIQQVPKEMVFNKHAILIGTEIYINQQDNPEKQRFSIAHEIFHFLTKWPRSDLLQAVARQGDTWKRKNAGSAEAIKEEISDYFAANLLIPTERFMLWEDKTDEEIASAFQVEIKCIKKRREEIEVELDLMVPRDLSSDVKIEETTPLTLDELKHILGSHNIKEETFRIIIPTIKKESM